MANNTPLPYALIDSGEGRKLERFGSYLVSRPCAQAVWKKKLPHSTWQAADAIFTRDEENRWVKKPHLPSSWLIEMAGIYFKIQPTDFGHLGVFPEQKSSWHWIQNYLKTAQATQKNPLKVLNLFAYSGGSTLASARAGANVCHLDASKGMVSWARENAAINKLDAAPIRWIIDDVMKFLQREVKRQSRYDAIILDPPTFGRGAQGELFKIEEQILPLLDLCRQILSDHPQFILFSCHTPGFSPHVLKNLLHGITASLKGSMDIGEMLIEGDTPAIFPIPSGTFARWQCE